MKGSMRASYDGSDMWRGWRGIGSPRESIKESEQEVVHWVGHGRYGLIL